MFDIGKAIQILETGGSVRRQGWNGKGMALFLQQASQHSKMSLPYIYLRTADAKLVPWTASQTDLLTHDWEIAD